MSYAGANSKSIADIFTNVLIVKYCFNTGNVGGTNNKGGIIGWITNNIGATTSGGKAETSVSYNVNTGNVNCLSNNAAGGIMSGIYDCVYSANSFCDTIILNNFNTGIVSVNGETYFSGGILGRYNTASSGVDLSNVNVFIKSNYNYSVNINGGNSSFRAGVVGEFVNNCSRVNLLNNYSTYKRGTDNNVHGTNPTTLGANVGEAYKSIVCFLLHILIK